MTAIDNGQVLLTRGDGTTLLMGPAAPNPYRVEKLSPSEAPDEVDADELNPGGGGEIGGLDLDGGRDINLLVTLTAWETSDYAQCFLDKETLEAAWQKGTDLATLHWNDHGIERLRFGRCRGVDVQHTVLWYKSIPIKFRALNPRAYAIAETSYLGVTDQEAVNAGPMRTIAWRVEVLGDHAALTVHVNDYVIHLPANDDADGKQVLDALQGECYTLGGGGARSALEATGDDGLPMRFATLAPGNNHIVSPSATPLNIYVRSCYP